MGVKIRGDERLYMESDFQFIMDVADNCPVEHYTGSGRSVVEDIGKMMDSLKARMIDEFERRFEKRED